MKLETLRAQVQLGEDSRRQFKADVTNADALASEVVAFLNARGGTLFVGVSDDGSIPGIGSVDVRRINQLVSNVASQHIKNPVSLLTENIPVGNSRVVVAVEVPEGNDKPYFDRAGIIWLKEGADKRRVSSKEEIRRLFEESALLHADEQPTRAGFDQLDLLRLRPFFEKTFGRPFPMEESEQTRTVKNMNLASDDGRLTLAGLLMFGLHPEAFVPQFSVKAVRVDGTDLAFTSYLDREEVSGTLQDLYAGAMGFLMRNMRKTQRSESVNLPGESEVPRFVFEELIVNALVHRNYFVDAPIRILVFDDRVEIVSPGSLPNHLTVEKILAGNTNIRNPVIASFVARGLLPYWGLGSGIQRVKAARNNVVFVDDKLGVQFRAIVPLVSSENEYGAINVQKKVASGAIKPENGAIKPEGGVINSKSGAIKTLREEVDQQVLAILLSSPGLQRTEMAKRLKVAGRSLERSIARLIGAGKIEHRGSKKTGGYFIKEP